MTSKLCDRTAFTRTRLFSPPTSQIYTAFANFRVFSEAPATPSDGILYSTLARLSTITWRHEDDGAHSGKYSDLATAALLALRFNSPTATRLLQIHHRDNAIYNLDLTSPTALASVHWPDIATDAMRFLAFFNASRALPPTSFRLLQETDGARAWGDAMAGAVVVHNSTTTLLASLMWRHLGEDPSQPLNNVTRLDVLGETYGHLVNVPTASAGGMYTVYSFQYKDLAFYTNAALRDDGTAIVPQAWQGQAATELVSNTTFAALPAKLPLKAQGVMVLQRQA